MPGSEADSPGRQVPGLRLVPNHLRVWGGSPRRVQGSALAFSSTGSEKPMAIPARLHFCWIGSTLPWAYVFAAMSAAERGELSEIVLHHTEALEPGEPLRALRRAAGVRLARIDALAHLTRTGAALGLGDGLALLYRRHDDPVIRSDILRAAILYSNGGLYADLDTVTVASLRPLLNTSAFVASEFIVWPPAARRSRSFSMLARHLPLDLLRKALRWLPDGWRLFRRVERLYCRGVNNAVMGAEAGSPVLASYLQAMAALPPERSARRYALGPHLLAEIVAQRPDGLTVQPPPVFSPLPPEISEHWFRTVRTPRLAQVLSPETRIVHWYASVRTRARVALIDPGTVRRHRDHQLYSALVCASIRDMPAAVS